MAAHPAMGTAAVVEIKKVECLNNQEKKGKVLRGFSCTLPLKRGCFFEVF